MHDASWFIGDYVVELVLGKGGTATVYGVRHGVLGTLHALKVYRDATAAHRIGREVQLQRRVRSPYVLPVTKTLELEGRPALLMPRVQGCSLSELIAFRRPGLDESLALLVGIVNGVSAIHEQGIVHRDLKPSNVLLDLQGVGVVPRVADFGIAMADDVARWTRTGDFVGTGAYAAPEQRQGLSTVDHRADLWSLGVLAHELLTGVRPIGLDGSPAAPPVLHDGVPDFLREPLTRMLHPDPARRVGSMATLRDRLDGAENVSLSVGGGLAEFLRTRLARFEATEPNPTRPSVGQLPGRRTTLIGRSGELAELRPLVEEHRLVNVVGFGGVGKTELTLELARAMSAHWPSGIWFCACADARDREALLRVVAQTLQVSLGMADPVTQLGHAIAARGRCLVILDNVEQIASASREVVAAWLNRSTDAHFLLTSRVRLGLRGEHVWPLGPLSTADACALFVANSRPEVADDPAIGDLVTLLDGLPLAIELAGARARWMTPTQLLARLGERFRLLAEPAGERPARQATLEATLDWSWRLLPSWARDGLAQLAVFHGGFTLQAAEAVLETEDAWTVDVLHVLVDHSLVRPIENERLDLLVSIAEFARQRLEESGRAIDVERRHGEYFARLGSLDPEPSFRATQHPSELDNLFAACRCAVERGDGSVAVHTLRAAWQILEKSGPFDSADDLASQVAPLARSSPKLFAIFVSSNLQNRVLQSRYVEAEQDFEQVLAAVRAVGLRRLEAQTLSSGARLRAALGDRHVAVRLSTQALQFSRTHGFQDEELKALVALAGWHYDLGNLGRSADLAREGLAAARALGDRTLESWLLRCHGNLAQRAGDNDAAERYHRQGLELAVDVGDRRSQSVALGDLAIIAQLRGSYHAALEHFEEASRIARQLGSRRLQGWLLGGLGAFHVDRGRWSEARSCLESALAIHQEAGELRRASVTLVNLGSLHLRQGEPDDAKLRYEEALKSAEVVRDPRIQGLALVGLGESEARQNRMELARSRWEQAAAIFAGAEAPLDLVSLHVIRAQFEAPVDPDLAREALVEAESIAATLSIVEDSDLGRLLDEARRAVAGMGPMPGQR